MSYRQLHIDKEAVATLGLLQNGLFNPALKLMNQDEANEIYTTKKYQGKTYPIPFLLAPAGSKNKEILTTIKKDEKLILYCDKKKCGYIIVEDVFRIDKDKRIKYIYGTNDPNHPGVKETYKRLGNYSIVGDFKIDFEDAKKYKQLIQQKVNDTNSKYISAIMLSGKPFHRAHERIIRTSLVNNDLIVIFILKPYINDTLPYDIRYKTIEYFCDNYLPKDKFILVPLENTYIFGGINELLLNSIVASNYGCTSLVIGKNSVGLGAFYEKKSFNTILNTIKGIDIKIEIMSEFVYCNKCSTLVSTNACPHGKHHHVNYHANSIMKMIELGILPPALLMRKEISSMLLNYLYPQRKNILNNIYQNIAPNSGLLDEINDIDFYEGLMNLYRTSSLT